MSDDERVQQVIDELDPTPAHAADWPVSRRATLRALASVGALAAVPGASAQSAGTVIADEAVLSNYGSVATASGYDLTIDGDTIAFDGDDTIGLPDGTTGTGVVTPSGASAREVIGPDGSTVWGTPAVFEVSIADTNEPIRAGDTLAVDYAASNTGVLDGVTDVALEIDSVEEDRDSDVSVAGGQTATGTLDWTTQDGETGSFTARVFSPDDSASVTVQVEPTIPDSVIHRYNFEDNSDTTTLTDIVGTADGTITGMTYTSSQADGEFAGDFDGTDDEVSIPATEVPPISFTFDIFPRSDGTFLSWAFDFGSSQGITIKSNNGDLEIVYGSNTGVIVASELAFDTRQHIGVTVNSSDEIIAYIDGSQVGSATSSNSGYGGSSFIGSENGENYGDAIVDDLDVDDGVLTQSEVQDRID